MLKQLVKKNNSMKKNRYFFLLIVTSFLISTLVKVDTQISPEVKIKIYTSERKIAEGATVKHVWRHYGLDQNNHFKRYTVNHTGIVLLPERKISASVMKRCWVRLKKVCFFWNPHLSWDAHSYILVDRGLDEGDLVFSKEDFKQKNLTLILKRKTEEK